MTFGVSHGSTIQTVEFSGTKTQDDLDLERLEALAREQKEEIKALEREIDFLSHKPGAKTPAPKFGGNTASTVVDSKTEENAPAPSPPYRYPTTRSANVEGLLVETRRGTGVQSDGVAHGLSPSPASARSPFHATDAAGTPSLSMGATSLGAALASVGKRDGHLLSKPSTTLSVKKSAPATAVDIKLEGHRPESSHRPESTASRRG